MNYLGHFEFGLNHRYWYKPIKFEDTFDINYWLEVWINYYDYVINNLQKKRVALICYEDLAENSIEYLKSKINELVASSHIFKFCGCSVTISSATLIHTVSLYSHPKSSKTV